MATEVKPKLNIEKTEKEEAVRSKIQGKKYFRSSSNDSWRGIRLFQWKYYAL